MDDLTASLLASIDEVQTDFLLNSAPLAECGRCHRRTWSPSEVGQEDRMTQPDGSPCGGHFSALESA